MPGLFMGTSFGGAGLLINSRGFSPATIGTTFGGMGGGLGSSDPSGFEEPISLILNNNMNGNNTAS